MWWVSITCISLSLVSPKGIAPITVVTHRDTLSTDEECENALYEASAATGSSPSHTFFVANYTREKSNRDPKIERMIFDILHYALLTAERAVKIMKQKERNKEEDETLRALSGTSVSGQVAPDSADGKFASRSSMLYAHFPVKNCSKCFIINVRRLLFKKTEQTLFFGFVGFGLSFSLLVSYLAFFVLPYQLHRYALRGSKWTL